MISGGARTVRELFIFGVGPGEGGGEAGDDGGELGTTLERVLADLFEFLSRMPPEHPRATVKNGWVTLEGSVSWPYQKQLVEKAVREIAGVKGITNRLVVERTIRRSVRRAAE